MAKHGGGVRKTRPADTALSEIRVARATLIGARECLTDALEFVNRGIDRLADAHAAISEAFAEAGIEFTPRKGPTPQAKKRRTRAGEAAGDAGGKARKRAGRRKPGATSGKTRG